MGTETGAVTELLINIILGCFSLVMLSWVLVGVQTFINDMRREKRERESAKSDEEYHLMRMEDLNR